jgi:hypothetical protein
VMVRFLLAFLVILAASVSGGAEAPAQNGLSNNDSDTVAVASTRPLNEMLPESLAGLRATASAREYGPNQFATLVGNDTEIYREYGVINIAARQYGRLRVEIVQTRTPFAAYGIFSYIAGEGRSATPAKEIGLKSVVLSDAFMFWQGNLVVKVIASGGQTARTEMPLLSKAAALISGNIGSVTTVRVVPALLESLPQGAQPWSLRYFLGPRSLGVYVHHGAEMFGFGGQAEAALAQYDQAERGKAGKPLKLLIVEYNTPQFALEAISRASDFVASLPKDEQTGIILKREGNYIVEATEVQYREQAERLVSEVKYPYRVNWLQNPVRRRPRQDPLVGQKVAQILISDFGIIGLMLMSGLLGGIGFGAFVFIKRRKQQREVFSDAGGMLRLDIEPLGGVSSLRISGGGGGVLAGKD